MKYTGNVKLVPTYSVKSNQPLDDRLVVDTVKSLNLIQYPYEGLVVSCLENDSLYMYKDESWNPITQDISFEEELPTTGNKNQVISVNDTLYIYQDEWKPLTYKIQVLEKSEYDELTNPDPNTFYYVIERNETEVVQYTTKNDLDAFEEKHEKSINAINARLEHIENFINISPNLDYGKLNTMRIY